MTIILIGIFLLLSFFVFFEKILGNDRLLFFGFIGLMLIAVAGLRTAGCDKDYLGYIKIFRGLKEYRDYRIEPTFRLFRYIINNFLYGKTIYLFCLYALIGVSVKFYAIKQTTDLIFLSVIFYFSNFYLLQDMTQIRAGVAAGLLLLSIKPLYDRNLISFILIVIIASLFHYSAIIFFMLWFLAPDTFRIIPYVLLIPLVYLLHHIGFSPSYFVKNFPIEVVRQKMNAYFYLRSQGLMADTNVFNVLQLFRISIACVFLFYRKQLVDHNKYFYLLLKIFIIGISMFVLFADIPAIGARLSELSLIVEILLIPMFIYILKPRFLGRLFLVFIAAGYFWLSIFYYKIII